MKYFRPELLARCRSLDDDVADAAAEEWEQAIAQYNTELDSLRPLLPRDLVGLIDQYSLHDGKVLLILLAADKPLLSIVVRLEGTTGRPSPELLLAYTLVDHPGTHAYSIRARDQAGPSQDRWWIQYDEIAADFANGTSATFSHSLLLTGGEIIVRFTDLHVTLLKGVILPIENVDLEAAILHQ